MRDKSQKGYHKTIVWEKLKELLIITYKLLEKLPKSEEFGLKSQMQRAIASAISNFVEGYLKKSVKEKQHFMEISQTSLQELEAQAEICLILGYWSETDYEAFDQKHSIACYFLLKYKEKVR